MQNKIKKKWATIFVICLFLFGTLSQALAKTEEPSVMPTVTPTPIAPTNPPSDNNVTPETDKESPQIDNETPQTSPESLPEALEETETNKEQSALTEQDPAESVLTAAPPLSGQAVYTYDPSGRLSTIALPDRTTIHFQYDDNNNLISINP